MRAFSLCLALDEMSRTSLEMSSFFGEKKVLYFNEVLGAFLVRFMCSILLNYAFLKRTYLKFIVLNFRLSLLWIMYYNKLYLSNNILAKHFENYLS